MQAASRPRRIVWACRNPSSAAGCRSLKPSSGSSCWRGPPGAPLLRKPEQRFGNTPPGCWRTSIRRGRPSFPPDPCAAVFESLHPFCSAVANRPSPRGNGAQPSAAAHPGQLQRSLMQGTESWRFLDGDQPIVAHPQGSFKADNPVALLAAAVAGLGLAYLSDCVIAEHLASGALVPVMVRYPPQASGIYVVRPPSPHSSRKVRVLTDALLVRFGGTAGD